MTPEAFNDFRKRMNERILGADSTVFKKVYNVDASAYRAGHLDEKTKELMGLTASMVLRCDDCVRYHIGQSLAVGATPAQIIEAFEIALVVGGTIVIPHLRRAMEYLDACTEAQNPS